MNILDLPLEIIQLMVSNMNCKYICNFKVNKLCAKIVDESLKLKFNMNNDNKKVIINCDVEDIAWVITLFDDHILTPELIIVNFDCEPITITIGLDAYAKEKYDKLVKLFTSGNAKHFGFPYDGKGLYLHAINEGFLTVLKVLEKNHFGLLNIFPFVVVDSNETFVSLSATIRRLIIKGADPNFKYNGETLYQYAIRKGKCNLVII